MTKKLAISYTDAALLTNNPWNPNRVDPENEQKIKNSIESVGAFKPIIVRELDDGTLQILGGQHRADYYRDNNIEAPIINLGKIDDIQARKILLADNARYGEDDSTVLAEIYQAFADADEDISSMLPISNEDITSLMGATTIDLDSLELEDEPLIQDYEEYDDPEMDSIGDLGSRRKPLKLKIPMDNYEFVTDQLNKIAQVIGMEDIDQGNNRGDVLLYLLKKHAM